MHRYVSNDSSDRCIHFALAVCALAISYALHAGIAMCGSPPPWWLEVPGVLGIYGIAYTVFDRWIWRWTPLRAIGAIRVPDIHGQWEVQIRSSHDDFGAEHAGHASIQQTWQRIAIQLSTAQSRSMSYTAAFDVSAPRETRLTYQYRNQPAASAPGTMHAHEGTVYLRMDSALSRMEGEYYSGRDRGQIGELRFERTDEEL